MRLQVFEKDELKQILDIHVYIALPPEQWSKILEQILLVVLILGRCLTLLVFGVRTVVCVIFLNVPVRF